MPKLGVDVGLQGESGSRSDVAKMTRLTHIGSRAFLTDFNCDAVIIDFDAR